VDRPPSSRGVEGRQTAYMVMPDGRIERRESFQGDPERCLDYPTPGGIKATQEKQAAAEAAPALHA